jgi:hypothetical protein
VQTEVWQALKPAKHEQLIKLGLIKIEPQWGRASGGRVIVKVYLGLPGPSAHPDGDHDCARCIVNETEAIRFFARVAGGHPVSPRSRDCDGICDVGQGERLPLDRYAQLQPLDGEHRSPLYRRYRSRHLLKSPVGLSGSAVEDIGRMPASSTYLVRGQPAPGSDAAQSQPSSSAKSEGLAAT